MAPKNRIALNSRAVLTDLRVLTIAGQRTWKTAYYPVPDTPFDERRAARLVQRVQNELQDAAERHFCEINGWRTGPDVRAFRLRDIGKRSGEQPDEFDTALFDHVIYARADGRCAAVICQPYGHGGEDAARRLAAEHDVALHVPPNKFASFHFPGATQLFVFTAHDHQMKWLLEQRHGFNDPTVFAPRASTIRVA